MNYIKKFEHYSDIRKSTNPIYYIEKPELEEIMCYLTDEFEYKLRIYNDKVIVCKSLEKKVVTIDCMLSVSDDKIQHFEDQLKNVMNRIYNITGRTFDIDSNRCEYTPIQYNQSVKIKIDDCRLEE